MRQERICGMNTTEAGVAKQALVAGGAKDSVAADYFEAKIDNAP